MSTREATLLLNVPLVLFLGHDEVLHGPSDGPFYGAIRFVQYIDRLTWLLRRYPQVGVVLSRDWVEDVDTTELAAILPMSFRARILGILMPTTESERDESFLSAIQSFAAARHARGWIALTDQTSDWPSALKNHLVDVRGTRSLLDPAIEKRLANRLQWLVSRSSRPSSSRGRGRA